MKYIFLLLGLLLLTSVSATDEVFKYYPAPAIMNIENTTDYLEIVIKGEFDETLSLASTKFRIHYNHTNDTINPYFMKWNSETNVMDWESMESVNGIEIFGRVIEINGSTATVVATCSEYIDNVTNAYTQTNVYRDKYDELFESTINMINETYHADITSNLTTERDAAESSYESLQRNKETEVLSLQEEIEKLERHRQWGWGLSIAGIGTALYLLNKYRGLGKRKQQIETEFPRDIPA